MVEKLLAELARLGIEVTDHGDLLRYRPRAAVTPELGERMKAHKAELLEALRPATVPQRAEPALAVDDLKGQQIRIDPPDPCPVCNGLMFWWNPLGCRRCMVCDPPTTAIRMLEVAQRIRRRHCIPSPTGVVEMLAEIKRLTDT